MRLADHVYHGADKVCTRCEAPNSNKCMFCFYCGTNLGQAWVAQTAPVRFPCGTGCVRARVCVCVGGKGGYPRRAPIKRRLDRNDLRAQVTQQGQATARPARTVMSDQMAAGVRSLAAPKAAAAVAIAAPPVATATAGGVPTAAATAVSSSFGQSTARATPVAVESNPAKFGGGGFGFREESTYESTFEDTGLLAPDGRRKKTINIQVVDKAPTVAAVLCCVITVVPPAAAPVRQTLSISQRPAHLTFKGHSVPC